MSLILSGPKRIYVLLLFWERLTDPCATCPRSLSRIGQALGVEEAGEDRKGCGPFCRVIVACRLSRILWRRFVGLSLLVLEPERATGDQDATSIAGWRGREAS